jgi:hypothetical protein
MPRHQVRGWRRSKASAAGSAVAVGGGDAFSSFVTHPRRIQQRRDCERTAIASMLRCSLTSVRLLRRGPGNGELVRLLVAKGAQVNGKNSDESARGMPSPRNLHLQSSEVMLFEINGFSCGWMLLQCQCMRLPMPVPCTAFVRSVTARFCMLFPVFYMACCVLNILWCGCVQMCFSRRVPVSAGVLRACCIIVPTRGDSVDDGIDLKAADSAGFNSLHLLATVSYRPDDVVVPAVTALDRCVSALRIPATCCVRSTCSGRDCRWRAPRMTDTHRCTGPLTRTTATCADF